MALTLVTDVSGLTGSQLALRLAKQGYAVRGLGPSRRHLARLRREGVEAIVGDPRDRAAVDRAIEGVGTVYHVAASAGDATCQQSLDLHLGGARNVVEAAQAHGADRVLYLTSAPTDPRLAAERYVSAFGLRAGLPTTIVRPVGAYCPGDTRLLDLFRSIARGRLVMVGDRTALCRLTFVDDFCDAAILAATSPEAVGRTYEIGGANAVSLEVLVRRVAAELNVRRPRLHVPATLVAGARTLLRALRRSGKLGASTAQATPACQLACAQHELGYQPRVEFGDGLRGAVRWYRDHALL